MVFPSRMPISTLAVLLLCSPTLTFALDIFSWWRHSGLSSRAVPPEGYFNPSDKGGSMLDQVGNTFPPGQGEPLNVIISGASDAEVLVDAEVNGGLRNYWLSFEFAGECLGQHAGNPQSANLGDGSGFLPEKAVIRYDYGDPSLGTCRETVQGGNHFRYWVQNGPDANSGAVFLATSYEKSLKDGHDIVVNGYNLGRDWLIGNATQSTIPTANLTDSMTFSGSTSFGGYTYQTDAIYVAGLLANTSIGINHNASVGINGANAVDGLVGVLTVRITQRPSNSQPSSTATRKTSPQFWISSLLLALLSLPFHYAV